MRIHEDLEVRFDFIELLTFIFWWTEKHLITWFFQRTLLLLR